MPSRAEIWVPDEVDFATFLDDVFQWEQGEHVTMIGPTGEGKTTLLMYFIMQRDYITLFGVKPHDETMEKFVKAGWKRQEEFDANASNHIVLWPKVKDTSVESQYKQRVAFQDAIDTMYGQLGWTFVFDEAAYMSDFLGMSRSMQMLLFTARASGITVVAMTQRPFFLPRAFYDQATHLVFWGDNDDENLKRIGGISGFDAKAIRSAVRNLRRREVLYIRTRHPRIAVRTVVKLRLNRKGNDGH